MGIRARSTVLIVFLASGVARAQLGPPPADVAALVESDAVRAGDAARAALVVRLPKELHANSNKPRDPLLIPLVLRVAPPAGVTVGEIVYPPARDLVAAFSDQPVSVFEGEFTIGVRLDVAAGTPPGEIAVPATLEYQACNDTTCFKPVKIPTSWTLRVVAAGAAVKPVTAEPFAGIKFGSGEAPGATPAATAPLPRLEDRSNSAENVAGALAALDRFTVAGTTNYVSTADFLQFVRNAEAGIVEKGLLEGRGPLAILVLVLLGGLALNLTPCVLPMIPINLAIIGAGAQAGSRTRGFFLGATYGAAMAVVYGVLGLVVVLTAGTFGAINASPWFNVAIALLFVVLALAMFDVLVIDFSQLSSRFHVDEGGRGTFLVAFTMGAVAALLAGACVAPVVIQVVLLSSNLYATGTAAALALPFFLGLGMALPWPIAGAGLAALPRPGAWMVRVKQAFGVFILGTAVYYGYTAYTLFASRWVDPAEVASSVEEKLKEGWHASLAEAVAVAERDGKPMLIDFWATWCKNCLLMDKTTFKDPEVIAALAGYVKVKFQAEDPDASPAREALAHFGAIGLPTYVVLKPKS
jgi:cytochrome c biogenesis protein CcdA/thiol-disulfide isomerase/thioredoxin